MDCYCRCLDLEEETRHPLLLEKMGGDGFQSRQPWMPLMPIGEGAAAIRVGSPDLEGDVLPVENGFLPWSKMEMGSTSKEEDSVVDAR
ncbi:hypothetical protein ACLOJK_029304 [Asimina triloba]